MKEEQFQQAKELIEKRDHYKELANQVKYAVNHKNYLDAKVRNRLNMRISEIHHSDRWQLSKFFSLRLKNKGETNKPVVAVLPHWEFAREIEMDAEPELVDLVINWLETKVAELNQQIADV